MVTVPQFKLGIACYVTTATFLANGRGCSLQMAVRNGGQRLETCLWPKSGHAGKQLLCHVESRHRRTLVNVLCTRVVLTVMTRLPVDDSLLLWADSAAMSRADDHTK
jgi:hypothetical protein